MAEIKITVQLRPCWVRGRKALFHRWTDSARSVSPRGFRDDETDDRFQMWTVHGLVEFEDGTVERVWPYEIQFTDTFNPADYDWGENKDLERDMETDQEPAEP